MRNIIKFWTFTLIGLFGLSGAVIADNISKTFEFGAGSAQTRSIVRTFPIACHQAVAVVVKFQRLGLDGAANDFPVLIEVRAPDTAADQEGPILKTESAIAKKAEQTVVLKTFFGEPRGCSLPWRVRVRNANDGAAPSRVSGSIRMDFNGGSENAVVESVGSVQKQGSKIVNVAGFGIKQGKVEITANWYHFIGSISVVGPNPIKLKIRLVDPNGTVRKMIDAYSSDELRSELPKFNLTYQVTDCLTGQWKVEVINDTNDDARFKNINVKFTPDCP